MKYLTAILAVIIAVGLAGVASASPGAEHAAVAGRDKPSVATPPDVTAVAGRDHRTGLPSADLVAVAVRDNPSMTRSAAGSSVLILPSAVTLQSPDGGLSAFLIVLISVAGTLALVGAAYAGTRFVHQHGHAAT